MEKRKNKFEIGEGSKQRRKLEEDVKPHKLLQQSTRQLGITILGMVTCHIPFKPQKENNSI
jgi:hypothetical protein